MSKRSEIVEAFAKCEALFMDFDGVFTDNTSSVGWARRGEGDPATIRDERCVCSHADGLGLSRMREAVGIPCVVITSQVADYVAARCDKLDLEVIKVERSMGGEGKLASGKLAIIDQLVQRFKLGLDVEELASGEIKTWFANVCFVGNDAPDVEALRMCGLSVAVADSEPVARNAAKYGTDRGGGCGALRDVCDLILQAKTGVFKDDEWYPYGVSDIRGGR